MTPKFFCQDQLYHSVHCRSWYSPPISGSVPPSKDKTKSALSSNVVMAVITRAMPSPHLAQMDE